jgi:hypothetical protein
VSSTEIFHLVRDEDETGVSGTGTVAVGVVFPDGTVAMRWNTNTASTAVYDSLEDVIKIHGHGGKTYPLIVASHEG